MSVATSPSGSPPWSPVTRSVVGVILLIALVVMVILALPLFESLLIAALLAYLLDPLVRFFQNRVHLKRQLSVIIVYALVLIVVASLPTTLGALALGQFKNFGVSLNEAVQALQSWLVRPISILGFTFSPQFLVEDVGQAIGGMLTVVPGGSLNIVSGLTTNLLWGLVIVISLYYFLKDGPKIKPWLVGFFPAAYQPDANRLIDEIDDIWSVFLRVQIFIFFVLAVLFILGSLLVVFLYQLGLIPFSWIGFALVLLIVYALVQQVDNLWLRPQLLGHTLRLHPGLVFVSLVGAIALSGLLGALIVVPGIATAKVIGRYIHRKMLGMSPWSASGVVHPVDLRHKPVKGEDQTSLNTQEDRPTGN